jgi:uncharacterized protein YegL
VLLRLLQASRASPPLVRNDERMGAISWRMGVVGAVLCGGCGFSDVGDVSEGSPKQKPPEEVLENGDSLAAETGRFAHLPRFVDGGIRCEVRFLEAGKRRGDAAQPRARPRVGRFLFAGNFEEEVPCAGPGPLCALLGPSEVDVENHRLREELRAEREKYEARTEQLRKRVKSAEEAAERERNATLGELGGLLARGIYLTNDESLSLASPQRLIWAIDHGAALPSHFVRPHELLNYFSFTTLPVNPGEVFSVLPELSPHPMRPSDFTLGFSVRGRSLTKESRHNANLAYVLDRSGSMARGERIELLKAGVLRSFEELKAGDIVSIVLFDTTTCPLAQNFVVGRDDLDSLRALVRAIVPRGGSNLRDGLSQGYEAANRSYAPGYESRVLLLTDAEGTGTSADEELISLSARNYDARRVRLSAVGIGETVSDELLDRLTEAGKGASMFVSSRAELDAIFGSRFPSLMETVATNVHFRLQLPKAVTLRAFYGEEASVQKRRVQAVHFFSGTQQMYLANLEKSRELKPTDFIHLTIEFDDPETGEPRTSEFSWRADELEMATGENSKFASRNLNKARMVATFGYQLRHMAETFGPDFAHEDLPIWSLGGSVTKAVRQEKRAEALKHCRRVKGRLDAFSAQLGGEKEAVRIVELWHRYCRRYEGGDPKMDLKEAQEALVAEGETRLVQFDAQRNNDFIPQDDDFDL